MDIIEHGQVNKLIIIINLLAKKVTAAYSSPFSNFCYIPFWFYVMPNSFIYNWKRSVKLLKSVKRLFQPQNIYIFFNLWPNICIYLNFFISFNTTPANSWIFKKQTFSVLAL